MSSANSGKLSRIAANSDEKSSIANRLILALITDHLKKKQKIRMWGKGSVISLLTE